VFFFGPPHLSGVKNLRRVSHYFNCACIIIRLVPHSWANESVAGRPPLVTVAKYDISARNLRPGDRVLSAPPQGKGIFQSLSAGIFCLSDQMTVSIMSYRANLSNDPFSEEGQPPLSSTEVSSSTDVALLLLDLRAVTPFVQIVPLGQGCLTLSFLYPYGAAPHQLLF